MGFLFAGRGWIPGRVLDQCSRSMHRSIEVYSCLSACLTACMPITAGVVGWMEGLKGRGRGMGIVGCVCCEGWDWELEKGWLGRNFSAGNHSLSPTSPAPPGPLSPYRATLRPGISTFSSSISFFPSSSSSYFFPAPLRISEPKSHP